jgi:hypothetical protein
MFLADKSVRPTRYPGESKLRWRAHARCAGCRPYGTGVRGGRAYPGLTSGAKLCRPCGTGAVVQQRVVARSSPMDGPRKRRFGLRSLDLLGISARGSDAAQPIQLEWGCSHVTGLVRQTKPYCPHAMGTHAFAPQRESHLTFCCHHPRRLFTTDASRRIFESGWNIPPRSTRCARSGQALKSQRARV